MDPTPLLKRIAKILEKIDARYIVTGGVAVARWGHPRFTADIDIVVALSSDKIDPLMKELAKIERGFADKDMIEAALLHHDEFNFIHVDSGLKVDFWIFKDDAFGREQIRRRVAVMFDRQKVYFASPEDLILSKLLWYKLGQSTRQLEDVASIIRLQKDKLDITYLNKWAKIHATKRALKKLLKGN